MLSMTPAITSCALILILGICRESSSWMLPSYSQLPKTTNYRSTAIYARPGIFFEDESECPEEDECEIDWGAMPGFEDDDDDDDDKSEEEKSNEKQEAAIKQLEETNEELDELKPQEAHVRQVEQSSERPGIFFEDESECPEEDECEIDWGAMPGFEDDDDDKSEEEKSNEKQEAVIEQLEEINEELDELEPQEAYVRQVERSLEKSRTIFEMNWEIENCIVDKDTCTDFCSDCAGSGKNWCKFCRGTRMISLGKDFRSCLLCSDTTDGRVDCSTCSGTGNISPWAKTHDKILKAKGSL